MSKNDPLQLQIISDVKQQSKLHLETNFHQLKLSGWLAGWTEWIITTKLGKCGWEEDEKKRNPNPQLNKSCLPWWLFYQGEQQCWWWCVGGSYWFGKYYDGRSPGFLFIITAMSPPFCAGIPGNYNTSNWCFNSSGHHRQVNTRLVVALSSVFSHQQRSPPDQTCSRYHCHVSRAIVPSFVSYFTLQYRRESRFIRSHSVSLLSSSRLGTLGPHLFCLS